MTKHKTRKQRGGNSPSGWGYVYNTVGNGWTQFQNALTLQPGDNAVSQQSNNIEPVGNPNFGNTTYAPSKTDLTLIQSAGKRKPKRSKKSRSRKGGNWAEVASRAVVPFALLGIQNRFSKKRCSRKSRKLSRRRK
uniref:Uncharacterized protein n=1 Tax=viral metagenome TaxID=1070528 RepID=A0A6C0E268_9ZZZZ